MLSARCIVSNALFVFPSSVCVCSLFHPWLPRQKWTKRKAKVGLRKSTLVQVGPRLIISLRFHLFISVILCSFCACYNLALFSLSHSCTVLLSKWAALHASCVTPLWQRELIRLKLIPEEICSIDNILTYITNVFPGRRLGSSPGDISPQSTDTRPFHVWMFEISTCRFRPTAKRDTVWMKESHTKIRDWKMSH